MEQLADVLRAKEAVRAEEKIEAGATSASERDIALLLRVVRLLVLADELAPDGYRDPRLPVDASP